MITSVRNPSESDPGEVAVGYFVVEGDTATLTDETGKSLDEKEGTAKIGDAELGFRNDVFRFRLRRIVRVRIQCDENAECECERALSRVFHMKALRERVRETPPATDFPRR